MPNDVSRNPSSNFCPLVAGRTLSSEAMRQVASEVVEKQVPTGGYVCRGEAVIRRRDIGRSLTCIALIDSEANASVHLQHA